MGVLVFHVLRPKGAVPIVCKYRTALLDDNDEPSQEDEQHLFEVEVPDKFRDRISQLAQSSFDREMLETIFGLGFDQGLTQGTVFGEDDTLDDD